MASLRIPNSLAIETAQESPRALKDPVGLSPSSLTSKSSAPTRAPRRGVEISGVIPSPSDTMEFPFTGGKTGAYRHMVFGPWAIASGVHVSRNALRSYKTSKGPEQSHKL